MADIFISYAREDREKAQVLAKVFEDHGWSVWWDQTISVGQAWRQLIQKELEAAKCVIVVWSNASIGSDFVCQEAEDGHDRKILAPVVIENVKPALGFRGLQTADLRTWRGGVNHLGFRDLLKRVIETVGPPKRKPKPKQEPASDILKGLQLKPGDLVEIPAGEFLYGPAKEKRTIPYSYLIDAFPITNKQYKRFLDENKDWPPPRNWSKKVLSYPKGKADHPVVMVSYEDCEQYCKWRSAKEDRRFRLPTEEEWEKAARGKNGFDYPWGNKFDAEKANTMRSGNAKTTSVTTYLNGVSPFACFDMSGNAWEWTGNFYGEVEDVMVLRGGSFTTNEHAARCWIREQAPVNQRTIDTGFRCVCVKA